MGRPFSIISSKRQELSFPPERETAEKVSLLFTAPMPGELPFPPAQRMRRNYCTFLTEGDLISASLGSISVRPQVPVYCPPHRSSAPGALWREMQLPGHFSANRGTNESKMSRRKWTKRQIYHKQRGDEKVKEERLGEAG